VAQFGHSLWTARRGANTLGARGKLNPWLSLMSNQYGVTYPAGAGWNPAAVHPYTEIREFSRER
jgi:hypothetical protein